MKWMCTEDEVGCTQSTFFRRVSEGSLVHFHSHIIPLKGTITCNAKLFISVLPRKHEHRHETTRRLFSLADGVKSSGYNVLKNATNDRPLQSRKHKRQCSAERCVQFCS